MDYPALPDVLREQLLLYMAFVAFFPLAYLLPPDSNSL